MSTQGSGLRFPTLTNNATAFEELKSSVGDWGVHTVAPGSRRGKEESQSEINEGAGTGLTRDGTQHPLQASSIDRQATAPLVRDHYVAQHRRTRLIGKNSRRCAIWLNPNPPKR